MTNYQQAVADEPSASRLESIVEWGGKIFKWTLFGLLMTFAAVQVLVLSLISLKK